MCLKLVLLSAGLLPTLWLSSTADGGPETTALAAEKRFSINMMDPFTRRSALDKNFVRFGRSGSSRDSRGRTDSFVRFGRSGYDAKEVAKRDGTIEDEEFEPKGQMDLIRLGRARADNFIRFGRARADNFIRFGRGMDRGNNGFIRFGRARPDNFIRFGRARPDNFIRFGRARQDNFIRFGRNQMKPVSEKFDDDDDDDELIDDYNTDFERIARGNQKLNSNFVRFGKRVPENNEEVVNAYKNGLKLNTPQGREFLERFIRQPSRNSKSDSFIRFGKSLAVENDAQSKQSLQGGKSSSFREKSLQDDDEEEEVAGEDLDTSSEESNLKDSNTSSKELSDIFLPSFGATTQNVSRKKRSLKVDGNNYLDNHEKTLVSADKSQLSSSFYSPLAAGLPGFILGPEFSILPIKEAKQKCAEKEKTNNFIRLG